MTKTSKIVAYKNPESFLKAEWMPEGDLTPMFMDVARIYPMTIIGQGSNDSKAFFYVYASDEYTILTSADTPVFLGRTEIKKEETFIFVNESSKMLADTPAGGHNLYWSGIPAKNDLAIKVTGKRIKLDQKAIGSLLIEYGILVDVWVMKTHRAVIPTGFIPKDYLQVFGIFLNDYSKSTSLTLFPTQEIEDPAGAGDADKWEPWAGPVGNSKNNWYLWVNDNDSDDDPIELLPWNTASETIGDSSAIITAGKLKITGGTFGDAYLFNYQKKGDDVTESPFNIPIIEGKCIIKISENSGDGVRLALWGGPDYSGDDSVYEYISNTGEIEIEMTPDTVLNYIDIYIGNGSVTIDWIDFK